MESLIDRQDRRGCRLALGLVALALLGIVGASAAPTYAMSPERCSRQLAKLEKVHAKRLRQCDRRHHQKPRFDLEACIAAADRSFRARSAELPCPPPPDPEPPVPNPEPPVAGQDIVDWGHPNLLREEADVNGDGLLDYCRFVGDEPGIFLSCQLRLENGRYGDDYGFNSVPGINPGVPGLPSSMRDHNGDGRADFCRFVGDVRWTIYVCALAGAEGFLADPEPPVYGQDIVDWGHPNLLREEADVNGDGLLDYCRFVGDEPGIFLSCQLRLPNGRYGDDYGFNSVPGIDRGLPGFPSSMLDYNGDGRADFCRFVGDVQAPFYFCALAGAEGFLFDR